MRVKAAMGEAGFLHQVGHADAVRALFAQPHRGLFHDSGVGFLLVVFRVTHGRPVECLKSYNNGKWRKKLQLSCHSSMLSTQKSAGRHLTTGSLVRDYRCSPAGTAMDMLNPFCGIDR